jgi:hypothetical protein
VYVRVPAAVPIRASTPFVQHEWLLVSCDGLVENRSVMMMPSSQESCVVASHAALVMHNVKGRATVI